jgi:hypothetical protein
MLKLIQDLVKLAGRVPGRSGERAEMNYCYSIPYLPNWAQIQNLWIRVGRMLEINEAFAELRLRDAD